MVLGSGIPESLKENLSLRLKSSFRHKKRWKKMPSLVFLTNELINPLELKLQANYYLIYPLPKAELVPYSESCGISARSFLENGSLF